MSASGTAAANRARPFGVYLVIWCSLLLAASSGSYMTIIDQTVGALPLMKRLYWNEMPERSTKVAILRSAFSAVRSGDHPEYYYDLANYWQLLLYSEDTPFVVITDSQLAAGLDKSINVLVLPWAVCLSDEQRESVLRFVRAGNGLVATGPLGPRNADCSWKGWEFMTELTGVREVESFAPEGKTYATWRGEQYFSGAIAPGMLVELPPHEFTVGMADAPDIYWSDAQWKPMEGASAEDVAIGVHKPYGDGRVVWFGYNERLTAARDQKPLDELARSAIRWASRQPLIAVASWPKHAPAAVMVTGDTGDNREAADAAVAMLRAANVPGTLFAAPGGVPASPGSIEIAATGNPDVPIVDRVVVTQVQILRDAKLAVERPGGPPVVGFKPPDDQWNLDTTVALRSTGYQYFLDRSQSRRAAPEMIEFPAATWFGNRVEVGRIGAGWPDDFDVIARYKGPTPWREDLADGFLSDFELNRFLGGLYTLHFRSQLLGSPANIHLLRSAVDRLKGQPVWFATASQAVGWWATRDKLRVETHKVNQHRIRMSLVNRNRHEVDGVSVYLHLPVPANKVRIISELIGKTPPTFELDADGERLRLDFPKLGRESSHVFLVALDES